MWRRSLAFTILVLALVPSLTAADYTDLQIVGTSVNGNEVSISIHNPDATAETARVRLTVQLADGETPTLTSSNFTLASGETRTITITASAAIASITDSPQPIDPAM